MSVPYGVRTRTVPHVSHGSKIGKYKRAYNWTPSRIVSVIGVALTRTFGVTRLSEDEAEATTRSMIRPRKAERIVPDIIS